MEFLQKRRFIEDLSEFVKEKLELREQLEIIQIISPDRTISPTDTNFVIGMCSVVQKLNELINLAVTSTALGQNLVFFCIFFRETDFFHVLGWISSLHYVSKFHTIQSIQSIL